MGSHQFLIPVLSRCVLKGDDDCSWNLRILSWYSLLLVLCLPAALHVFSFIWTRRPLGAHPTPQDIPSAPGALPFLGHLLPVLRNYHRLPDWLYDMSVQFNFKPWYFAVPFNPGFYVTTNPVCLEYILKGNFDNFEKGKPFYSRMFPLLGNGIFNVDGHEWYTQRKTAAAVFNTQVYRRIVEHTFPEKMATLMAVLGGVSSHAQQIDFQQVMYAFTLDTFAHIGFGTDVGALASPGKLPFAGAFDNLQSLCHFRFWIPAWAVFEAVTGWRRVIQRDVKTIRQFVVDLIKERRQQTSCKGSDNADLVSIFLALQDERGQPLSTQVLTDYMLNFIIAGRDTTAQALSWTLYEVLQRPEIVQKIRSEVVDIIGASSDASSLSYDQVRSLRYTKAVFLDALRLHPSVPKDGKFAKTADRLPDGTYIPAGANCFYLPYVMGRMESLWGPDPLKLKPERWLDNTLPSSYHYPVFNAGPRICLGKSLAELQGAYVLACILHHFDIKITNMDQVKCANTVTLPMRSGLQCIFSKREL